MNKDPAMENATGYSGVFHFLGFKLIAYSFNGRNNIIP